MGRAPTLVGNPLWGMTDFELRDNNDSGEIGKIVVCCVDGSRELAFEFLMSGKKP